MKVERVHKTIQIFYDGTSTETDLTVDSWIYTNDSSFIVVDIDDNNRIISPAFLVGWDLPTLVSFTKQLFPFVGIHGFVSWLDVLFAVPPNFKYNPMIYKSTRQFEILFDFSLEDYRLFAVSHGSHPCAYVGVPLDHCMVGKEGISLEVHGGITFASYIQKPPFDKDHYWFGWDYSHSGDFSYSGFLKDPGKRWTTIEILIETITVYKQLKLIQDAFKEVTSESTNSD